MKRKQKIIIFVISLLVLTSIGFYCYPFVKLFYGLSAQMKAGRSFMDSLTDEDIQSWIQRTDQLLADYNPAIPEVPVPEDLKALKILRIDVLPPDGVHFVWAGGLDHTAIVITKDASGSHTVDAIYNDEESRQLWPKHNTSQ